MAGKKLVIVESPAKARTIGNYLGADFDVEASIGHIRDLPQPSDLPADMKKSGYGRFAVDVDADFDPYYVVSADKKKTVAALKRKLKDADELYLATDEDREGEAIAWHLLEVLKPKVPVKRMVFHEITREAIERALNNTREVDTHLVDAQETRRILDRLVGYEVSPLLWRKVAPGLSAGRVQSVATRLVVDRERERMNHVAATYWGVDVTFTPGDDTPSGEFLAALTHLDGRRVATGRDFNDDATVKKASEVVHLNEEGATAIAAALEDHGSRTARVESVESKPYRRRPAAPFTTSTLQQEAGRKLKWNSRDTMRTAQALYENGYITYMRTDSTALSEQAVRAAREQARDLFGASAVPNAPRIYQAKAKGAQEAHEAIRPAGDHFRTPDAVAARLNSAELALYTLIWKRTIASQMTDATGTTDTVRIGVDLTTPAAGTLTAGDHHAIASVSGTVITHRGFLAAYEEGRDASRYEQRGSEGDQSLPELAQGQAVSVVGVEAGGHVTTPPPRYTEASLVKALEERGIGRPSTYAATISVIVDRGYVAKRGQALVPSWLAFSVIRLLEDNLGRLVDYDFTARMEEDLDRIAAGEAERVAWLRSFYHGDADVAPRVGEDGAGLRQQVETLGDIDAREVNSMPIGEGMTLRVGRYGPYLEREGDDTRANVPDDVAPDELTVEKARELFALAADGGRVLGRDPQTGREIKALNGRFGPYVTEVVDSEDGAKTQKPRTASLLKTMDLATVTLEDAMKLLSLPREVGVDPDSNEVITAQNGRYGPYIKRGSESRSLDSEEAMFSVTLEEALALFAQPKGRGRRTASAPLRTFGEDPDSGKPVVIKDGRFGPYITDGTTNVTVPRAESVEDISEARAFELLAAKRAKGPSTRGRRASTAKKTAAKKTRAKKTTAKKTTAKKTTGKKTATKTTTAKSEK